MDKTSHSLALALFAVYCWLFLWLVCRRLFSLICRIDHDDIDGHRHAGRLNRAVAAAVGTAFILSLLKINIG